MTSAPYRVILIAGPTGSGKSELALALAERTGGVIVNADSMQVYDAAPILTARPGADDLTRAPHRLYGFVPPQRAYSVGEWLEDVARLKTKAALGTLIFVGGTGLYFNTLTQGLSEIPAIPEDIRTRWREAAETGKGLHAALASRDPEMARRVRPSDTHRLTRALEVIDATGISLGEWQSSSSHPLAPADEALRIVVAPPREELYARIDARFDAMIAAGALEEARAVVELNLDPTLPFTRALGLKPLIAHLRGELPLDEATDWAKMDSRRYAKRQMTWLRKFMSDWQWVKTPGEGFALAKNELHPHPPT